MAINRYWIALLVISFFSCRKNLDEVTWDTDLLVPIAYADLSISNLAKNDDNLSYQSDGLVYLSFQENLFSYNPLDTLELNVDPFLRELTLETLVLEDQIFSENFNFGDVIISQGMETTAPDNSDIPSFLIALIPPITNMDPIVMDVSEFFEYAVLSQGNLDVNIDNQFPVNIDELTFEIRNSVAGNTLYTKSFTNIPSGGSASDNIDLFAAIGTTPIEGVLEVVVTNLTISPPPGLTIHIDYQDYINFSVSLTNLKVQSAKAIFPDQNVIDHTDEVVLQNMGDLELKSALIDSGFVVVNVKSSLGTELYLDYTIPSATISGQPFIFSDVVPAAPAGGTSEVNKQYTVKDFSFDFTGNDGLKVNTFVNTIVGRIKQTTQPVDVTLDDTLFVEISVTDLRTSQIEGYVGKIAFTFGPETENISLLDGLDYSLLNFKEAKASINVRNGIGISGTGDINSLVGINTNTSSSHAVSPINNINLQSALGNKSQPQVSVTKIDIPNAINLININPDELEYEVNFDLNPNGNTPAYSNFVNKDYPISGDFLVEMPLDVRIENLQMVDTFEFVSEDLALAENINSSNVIVNIENDFPLSATAKLFFLDQNEEILDSLILPDNIDAALIEADGKTHEPSLYRYKEKVSSERLVKILDASSIKATISFNTSPSSQHVKFYEEYLLKVRISSDLNLTVQNKL